MVKLHLLEVLVIVDILSLLRVLQSVALQGRRGVGGGRREGRRKGEGGERKNEGREEERRMEQQTS